MKKAIRNKVHDPADLYFDDSFFNSLRFKSHEHKDTVPRATYESPILGRAGTYRYTLREKLLIALESIAPKAAANKRYSRPRSRPPHEARGG
ncbi:MAG: hypothetical protein HY924_13595 [Elusimicrobia bacterium]|nr:hypothetical protein [Elusimicrobiota bacterium]